MILHLLSDEKFVDYVVDIFEKSCKGLNDYLIPCNEEDQLKYVASQHENLIVRNNDQKLIQSLLDSSHQYELIVAHNFYDNYKKELVPLIPEGIHVHWMCWGTDLYSIPQLNSRLISASSRSVFSRKNKSNWLMRFEDVLKEKTPNLWDRIALIKGNKMGYLSYKKVLERVDSFSTVIPAEKYLIKKYFDLHHYFSFKYATLENSLLYDKNPTCSQHNFLLGNSATITNNHIDIIDILITSQVEEQVHLTLSYGDSSYREEIVKYINGFNKSNFNIYTDFLTKREFNLLLQKCGNVVMNHYRQQGLGTILIALWQGSRVFLNKRNQLYHYLISLGLELYMIEDIPNFKQLKTFKDLALVNRPILAASYGEDRVVNEINQMLESILYSKS